MKKALLVAIIGVFAVSVNAGDWGGGKGVAPKGPIEAGCPDTSGNVSVSYVTDYILHGFRINRDSVVVDVNYTFESVVPITVGVSHFAGINDFVTTVGGGGVDETDVYLSAAVGEFGGFAVSVDYRHRFFPNGNVAGLGPLGSTGELGLTLRRDLGFADLILGTDYVLNALTTAGSGWVHRAGVEKAIGISDSMDLVLSAGVGYHDGVFQSGSGWSHYYLGAALPIQLNCAATLTPYIGYTGVQQWNQFNNQGDALTAGISLSVNF